jgi:hypothetical protein
LFAVRHAVARAHAVRFCCEVGNGLDRHAEGWEAERDSVRNEGGWPLYLQRFADLLKAR